MSFKNDNINKILNIIERNTWVFLLIIISIILAVSNYKFGTYLSGWDTLHPEFNLHEYWLRITQSVWQEHQGLGAVATQSHASEIPRFFYVFLANLIFPLSFVRWSYFLLMLILGPIGIYLLIDFLFEKNSATKKYAFIGALFYLLNLGTLQHFYAPLEMFATLYGFMGWLFLSLLIFLKKPSIKNLLIYILVTFFAAPMAHTATLWYMYFFFLLVFLATYTLIGERKAFKENVKKSAVLVIVTLTINAFWLLPNIYFVLNHAEDVKNAKITKLFSEEAIMYNQKYANIKDIAIIKGYLFDWRVHSGGETFRPMFVDWQRYYENTFPIWVGYVFFAIVIFGTLSAIYLTYIKSKKEYRIFVAFIPILLLSIFFLMMNFGLFGFIFTFLQNTFPLFKEALRLPFTKISLHLMAMYSIFFAFGIFFIGNLIDKFKKKGLSTLFVLFFAVLLILYTLPGFKGNLISNTEKVRIPQKYFQVYGYLNKYDDIRIATLPVHTMFGWNYYDWVKNNYVDASYEGAGFDYFISKNPILEREFDRWYPTNEDFYNEFQYAIYSENNDLLNFVLDKYDVNYLVLDKSVISPGSEKAMFIDEIVELLANNKSVTVDKVFDDVVVYKFDGNKDVAGYVETPKEYSNVFGNYEFANVDSNYYWGNSNYISSDEDSIYYPYYDDKKDFKKLADNYDEIDLPDQYQGKPNISLNVKDFTDSEYMPVEAVLTDNNLVLNYLYPTIYNKDGNVLYKPQTKDFVKLSDINKQYGVLVEDIPISRSENRYLLVKPRYSVTEYADGSAVKMNYGDKIYSAVPNDCSGGQGVYGKEYTKYPGGVKIKAKDKNTCLDFQDDIVVRDKKVIKVDFMYRNSIGAKPYYCLEDMNGACVNKKYQNAPLSNSKESFSEYTDYVVVTEPGVYKFRLIVETDNKKDEQYVEFKNIGLTKYNILNMYSEKSNVLARKHGTSVKVKLNEFPLKLDLSVYNRFDKSYEAGTQYYLGTARNCDKYNDGDYSRELQLDDKGVSYNYYAKNAISCDNVSLFGISPGANYLVDFDSEYKTGKEMDICIASQQIDKCMLKDRLFIGNDTFIYPSYSSVKDINYKLGVQSIGNLESEIKLYKIDFDYIPYSWLKGLNLSSDDSSSVQNSIKLTSVGTRNSKYIRAISVTSDSYGIKNEDAKNSNSGVIMFNQSYEKGWHLYDISDCSFRKILPILCHKVNSHVIAKNWANGWVVPAKNENYMIIFVPQYLQYVGYILILGMFIVIAVTYLKASTDNT